MDRLPYKPVRIVGYLDPDLKRRFQMRLKELTEERSTPRDRRRFTFNDWLRGAMKRELGEVGDEPCYSCGTSKAQCERWKEGGAISCCPECRHEPE